MEMSNQTLCVTLGPFSSAEPLLQQEMRTNRPKTIPTQLATLTLIINEDFYGGRVTVEVDSSQHKANPTTFFSCRSESSKY